MGRGVVLSVRSDSIWPVIVMHAVLDFAGGKQHRGGHHLRVKRPESSIAV
jgi:hypothetical protein